MAKCDMKRDCPHPVTHIGSKGYVYCESCAVTRRGGGHEQCRKMRAWELRLIEEGKPLPSYESKPRTPSPSLADEQREEQAQEDQAEDKKGWEP